MEEKAGRKSNNEDNSWLLVKSIDGLKTNLTWKATKLPKINIIRNLINLPTPTEQSQREERIGPESLSQALA